jgi:Uma2 family endonuclease
MVAEPQFMTAREFAKLPESPTPMELVDGVVIVSPSPTFHHQVIADRLTHDLVQIARQDGSGVWSSSPVDLYISPNNVYQPDAMFFTRDRIPDFKKLPITEIPEIVIEVLSPASRSHDNIRKRAAYSDRGISEYWIVDPEKRRIVFNVAVEDGTYASNELNGAIIPVGRFAGVTLDLDWIFGQRP